MARDDSEPERAPGPSGRRRAEPSQWELDRGLIDRNTGFRSRVSPPAGRAGDRPAPGHSLTCRGVASHCGMYCQAEKSPEASIAAPSGPTEPLESAPGEPQERSEDAADAEDLSGCPAVLEPALRRRGFTQLTAVQRAIADADDGARDLRISSQTGSGKTVAIGFALLDGLAAADRAGPTTLVIAPTRELAMQVKDELAWLFADVADVVCDVVTGGTNIERERLRLRRRPAVLVGTPGRLLDHLRRGALDLASVRQLVLDEADQMLDLGFKDELDGILDQLPPERRTHLVSATFPRAVLELADRFQRDALDVEGTGRGEAHADIEHVACRIGSREHYQAVVNLLLMAGDERTLVFVRTRENTVQMADKLAADGFAAMPINGDLAQAQRTRTLQAFRRGTVRTLIATDVAARGLDIPSVTMVIHVELPIDAATYVHRSGRTGRAGQQGKSVLLVPKSRAPRTQRLYREARIEPSWRAAPTAQLVRERQLERLTANAEQVIAAAGPASDGLRAAAARLLQERDPIEVVAELLLRSGPPTRSPFDLAPAPAPAARPRSRPLAPTARAPKSGCTRFRINWGLRDGADPRRILAHICRRGDIRSGMVGSIRLDRSASTFDVDNSVAESFSRRVRRRDRRDPHLFITPA